MTLQRFTQLALVTLRSESRQFMTASHVLATRSSGNFRPLVRFHVGRRGSVGLASAATTEVVKLTEPSELATRPIRAQEIQITMTRTRNRKWESQWPFGTVSSIDRDDEQRRRRNGGVSC
jgi:hypothetical protein